MHDVSNNNSVNESRATHTKWRRLFSTYSFYVATDENEKINMATGFDSTRINVRDQQH